MRLSSSQRSYSLHELHSVPTRRSSDLHVGVADQPSRQREHLVLMGPHQGGEGGTVAALRPDDELLLSPLFDRIAVFAVTHRRARDRKSTRLNSSHVKISYAVFCLKKKK